MATTLEYRESHTPGVRLEPLKYSQETLDLWTKWMNDPDIRQYMYQSLTSNKDRIKEWLKLASISESRHYFTIHVDNPPTGEASKNIGFVSVRQDKNPKDTAEIGIIIGEKEYQGKRIGSTVLKEVLAKCKDDYRLSSVRALIKPLNEKSVKLFTKLGFVEDARVTILDEPFIRYVKTFK